MIEKILFRETDTGYDTADLGVALVFDYAVTSAGAKNMGAATLTEIALGAYYLEMPDGPDIDFRLKIAASPSIFYEGSMVVGAYELSTRLPDATPGAAGGLFICGTNAPVTITGSGDALTITSTGANGSAVKLTGHQNGAGLYCIGGTGIAASGTGSGSVGLNVSGLDYGAVFQSNGTGFRITSATGAPLTSYSATDTPSSVAGITDQLGLIYSRVSNLSISSRISTTLPLNVVKAASGDKWMQVDVFLQDTDGNMFDSRDHDGGNYSTSAHYVRNDRVKPTTNNAGAYFFKMTVPVGVDAGGAAADWSTAQTLGQTCQDANGNTWENIGATDPTAGNLANGFGIVVMDDAGANWDLYTNTAQTWSDSICYVLNESIKPTVNNAGGFIFVMTTQTYVHTNSAADWSTAQTPGQTCVDGSGNTWTNVGLYTKLPIVNQCHHHGTTSMPQIATHLATGTYRFFINVDDAETVRSMHFFMSWFDKARWEVGFSTGTDHKRQLLQMGIQAVASMTAEAIADAVLDEVVSGHTVPGSVGVKLAEDYWDTVWTTERGGAPMRDFVIGGFGQDKITVNGLTALDLSGYIPRAGDVVEWRLRNIETHNDTVIYAWDGDSWEKDAGFTDPLNGILVVHVAPTGSNAPLQSFLLGLTCNNMAVYTMRLHIPEIIDGADYYAAFDSRGYTRYVDWSGPAFVASSAGGGASAVDVADEVMNSASRVLKLKGIFVEGPAVGPDSGEATVSIVNNDNSGHALRLEAGENWHTTRIVANGPKENGCAAISLNSNWAGISHNGDAGSKTIMESHDFTERDYAESVAAAVAARRGLYPCEGWTNITGLTISPANNGLTMQLYWVANAGEAYTTGLMANYYWTDPGGGPTPQIDIDPNAFPVPSGAKLLMHISNGMPNALIGAMINFNVEPQSAGSLYNSIFIPYIDSGWTHSGYVSADGTISVAAGPNQPPHFPASRNEMWERGISTTLSDTEKNITHMIQTEGVLCAGMFAPSLTVEFFGNDGFIMPRNHGFRLNTCAFHFQDYNIGLNWHNNIYCISDGEGGWNYHYGWENVVSFPDDVRWDNEDPATQWSAGNWPTVQGWRVLGIGTFPDDSSCNWRLGSFTGGTLVVRSNIGETRINISPSQFGINEYDAGTVWCFVNKNGAVHDNNYFGPVTTDDSQPPQKPHWARLSEPLKPFDSSRFISLRDMRPADFSARTTATWSGSPIPDAPRQFLDIHAMIPCPSQNKYTPECGGMGADGVLGYNTIIAGGWINADGSVEIRAIDGEGPFPARWVNEGFPKDIVLGYECDASVEGTITLNTPRGKFNIHSIAEHPDGPLLVAADGSICTLDMLPVTMATSAASGTSGGGGGLGDGNIMFTWKEYATGHDNEVGFEIPDVSVSVYNGPTVDTFLMASGVTDEQGKIEFYLNAGTYWFFRHKAGRVFQNPIMVEVG